MDSELIHEELCEIEDDNIDELDSYNRRQLERLMNDLKDNKIKTWAAVFITDRKERPVTSSASGDPGDMIKAVHHLLVDVIKQVGSMNKGELKNG